MNRVNVHNWKFRNQMVLLCLAVAIFALLAAPVYRIPVAGVPVLRPPVTKLVTGHIGTKPTHVHVLSFVVGYVPDALDVVREEQNRTEAERKALDAFVAKVDAISPMSQLPTVAPQQLTTVSTPGRTRIQEVRQAYEETMMAVPHYEAEYDDTVAESLTEEFSQEIAAQVVTGQTYTPLVKEQLIEAAQQRRRERERFLSTLRTEQEVLETAQTTVAEIDTRLERVSETALSEFTLDELIQTYGRLTEAEQECESLLEQRQQQRVDGHAAMTRSHTAVVDLHPYLYSSLPVTYPVLADATTLVEQLQRSQQRFIKELAARF